MVFLAAFLGFFAFAGLRATFMSWVLSKTSSSAGVRGSNISPHSLQIIWSLASLCTMLLLAQSGHSLI